MATPDGRGIQDGLYDAQEMAFQRRLYDTDLPQLDCLHATVRCVRARELEAKAPGVKLGDREGEPGRHGQTCYTVRHCTTGSVRLLEGGIP
jgi:hypothetical protein